MNCLIKSLFPSFIALIFVVISTSIDAKGYMIQPSKDMIAATIDHTYLKTEKDGVSLSEQKEQVIKLVEQAHNFGAYSVCVREHMVGVAKELLTKLGSKVKVTTVIGFPLGDDFSTEEKIHLVEQTRSWGADEYDMVIRYRDLIAGNIEKVFDDVYRISLAVGPQVLKVIIENAYLNEDQKIMAYQTVVDALEKAENKNPQARLAIRFLKTSTGFARPMGDTPVGATLADVKAMHAVSLGRLGIKPAGGVSSYQDAIDFYEMVGSPLDAEGQSIDPMKFRIGSSSLLLKLAEVNGSQSGDY